MLNERISFETFVNSLTDEQILFLACTFNCDLPGSIDSLIHFMDKRLKEPDEIEKEQISKRMTLMFTKKLYH